MASYLCKSAHLIYPETISFLFQELVRPVPIVYSKSNIQDFLLEEDIQRNTIKVNLFIVDYFFKDGFKGIWIGSGLEYWDGEKEN